MEKNNEVKKQKVVFYSWRKKLSSKEERLKYLRTGERYWYSDDWFGSEKRKNPA